MFKKTFKGGVHPDDGKRYAKDAAYRPYLPQGELVFPMSQHIGKPAKPLVKKGDAVLAGQVIGEADGFVSANIISSCSGIVKAVENRRTASGAKVLSVVIENDGQYTMEEGIGAKRDYKTLSKEEILGSIQKAGIVGMGGAGFPVHVKLAPKNADEIRYVIANGAECEPYITCDDQLMRTKSMELAEGMRILLKLFPAAEGVFLIEENKPEAIEALQKACQGDEKLKVHAAKCKYPQGGERSIIQVIAGIDLKLGMLPADAGCVVDNVATIYAIYQAVCQSTPLMERGFTVSGDVVKEPANLIVKIGTDMAEVLEAAGGIQDGKEAEKYLSGGPMMGMALADLHVPICKNNNALTVLGEDPVAKAEEQRTACLRCGRCTRVCPLGLSPQEMMDAAKRKRYVRYEKKLYGLECIACGSCTYVCPAKQPLMQTFKQVKSEIMAKKRAAQAQQGGAKK